MQFSWPADSFTGVVSRSRFDFLGTHDVSFEEWSRISAGFELSGHKQHDSSQMKRFR
jgi:hypothetical protein